MRTHQIWVALALTATTAGAQSASRPLTPADWDRWRSIVAPQLSRDGRWVAYSLHPQVGDGELVVRATSGAMEYRVPRGFIGRPQMEPGARADSAAAVPPAQLSADSRFVVALTYETQAAVARRPPRERTQPRSSLAIVDLSNGQVTTVPRVRSFRMPRDVGGWVAYQLATDDSGRAAGDSSAGEPAANAASPGGAVRPVARSARGRRSQASTLVLRHLASGREHRIPKVTSYVLDDSARWLGHTVSDTGAPESGAFVRALADCVSGACGERARARGKGEYSQLVFDRAGRQVAFFTSRDDSAARKTKRTLYHGHLASGAARPVVPIGAFGDSLRLAEGARVEFVRSGAAVTFGLTPPPLDSIPADSLFDKAIFDLWHWRDPRLQPQQRLEVDRGSERAHTAIWHVGSARAIRLATDSIPSIQVSDDGRVALGSSNVAYSIPAMWGEGGFDVHLIDARTGTTRRVAERVQTAAQLSPAGRYALWFDDGRWWSQPTAGGRAIDLTGALRGVRYGEEEWDTPADPAPYGLAGWTGGDRSVVIYDRYDLWEVDPSGRRPPRVVTDSVGRRERTAFRIVTLDPDRQYLDHESPLLLRAFNENTKAAGFWRDRISGDGDPERVMMADASFPVVRKANDAEQWLVSRSTFAEFPNLHAGPSLTQLTRISDANPQQAQFAWGSVELVRWRSTDGVPLQGLLYKPASFDSTKRYPLIAYFYERLSDNLHNYVPPSGRNVINATHYASNGYLVFQPDIVYEEGYPGPSAMKSIVPGVQMLIARGFVDPERLGLQGQSWGGYQAAYMITQTNMFRAAMAGAPVANMFSAYGGIRWQTGLNRAFQYEKGQSRIGGSIWTHPLRYMENSPLFWADKIRTPLLMMHNDNDGAVPWYQGIELFVALRRLGKEVYLLNYNGDEHNPTKRANQKDVAMRMQQFFDHHLRGHPAPAWMREGIPYRMKNRDQVTDRD